MNADQKIDASKSALIRVDPCPNLLAASNQRVGTLRFAHPTWLILERSAQNRWAILAAFMMPFAVCRDLQTLLTLTQRLPSVQMSCEPEERGRQKHKRLRLRGFGQLFRSFSLNSYGYSPQMIEKSDSKPLCLAHLVPTAHAPGMPEKFPAAIFKHFFDLALIPIHAWAKLQSL